MNERDAVSWLHRAAGFGLPVEELRAAVDRGAAAEIERLLDPAGAGMVPTDDPWDDTLLPHDPKDRAARTHAIGAWLGHLARTEQPVVDRMVWFWHGHLVSGLEKVRVARLMVEQIRLFRQHAMGSFPALLNAATLDPAMMIYLDLRTSTGSDPNENFARELMELFALGEGQYTEADVQAAAVALTGWVYRPAVGVQFARRLHDDTPQTLLGTDGVHDLDGVLATVLAHPAVASFVAGSLAEDVLGTTAEKVVAPLADAFAGSGFDVRALVRAVLEAGVGGAAQPVVLAPVPWLTQALRVCSARLLGDGDVRDAARLLREAGQLPMLPPNVAGWPGGAAWFGAGGLVARANLASIVASRAEHPEVLEAAGGADHDRLAEALCLPTAGFSEQTKAALDAAQSGAARLAAALVSPEFTIVEAPR